MFSRPLNFNIRYKYLISDGDEEKPYDEAHDVENVDCMGHFQKRMGTALRELKKQYRGKKLSDGKTKGGTG